MKTILILLAMISAHQARAGKLLWIDSTMVDSYEHVRADGNCEKFSLGVQGTTYWIRVCGGQAIVKEDMNSLITSPRSVDCVKYETCRGNQCHREYGIRREDIKMLLVIGKNGQLETYKMKAEKGPCL